MGGSVESDFSSCARVFKVPNGIFYQNFFRFRVLNVILGVEVFAEAIKLPLIHRRVAHHTQTRSVTTDLICLQALAYLNYSCKLVALSLLSANHAM